MQYRSLGSTGLTVSEIGFGAWGIGGAVSGANAYGVTDDTESKLALERALELGITFYDTADIYGYGHSEELLGEVFGNRRSKVIIASKVGFTKHGGPHDVSKQHIRAAIEGTLRRLKTDYVDIYQLHSPPMELLRTTPGAIDEMRLLKREGKIRAFGISVKDPRDGFVAIDEFGAESIQVNFSMIDQRALDCGLFDKALAAKVGIIGRTPLAFGFLTDKVKDTNFSETDHRTAWPQSQLKLWVEAPNVFSFVNHGKPRTAVQLALRFCLSFNAVSTVIPGMLKPIEVEENAKTSDIPKLTTEEIKAIGLTYHTHEFFKKN